MAADKKSWFGKVASAFVVIEDDDDATGASPPKPKAKAAPSPRKQGLTGYTRQPHPKEKLPPPREEAYPDESDYIEYPQDDPGELATFSNIYREAGLPEDGATVNKLLGILQNPHMRGMDETMVVASVMLALETSGMDIQDIISDATYRAIALEAYEKECGPRFQEMRAQVDKDYAAHEVEIQQLEADYQAALQRKNQEIARLVATLEAKQVSFRDWQHKKEWEVQNIHDAIAPFVKGANPVRITPANNETDES